MLNFPNTREDLSPLQSGDIYVADNGITYVYDGEKWRGGGTYVSAAGASSLGWQLTSGTSAVSLSADGPIILTPSGGDNANQALLIYPTAGGEGDHIHLTAGGGTTELFLGNDSHYVKLANSGNVEIRADDMASAAASWTFGTDGTLTLPSGAQIGDISGLGPDLSTGFIDPKGITIGTGFANDITITTSSGIAVWANNNLWQFGADGSITLPSDRGQIGLDGYTNGIDLYNNIGSGYVRMNHNDASFVWVDPAGAHIQTTGGTWDFGTDGGLTFPLGNKFFGDEIMTADYSGDTIINGNQHITGNLQVDGIFTFTGTATVISVSSATFFGDTNGFGAFYAGVVGYTPLPVTVMQASANYNDYVQNNFQNLNNGVTASTEWVATADNGNDSNNYIDMGVASSQWNGTQVNSVGTAAGINDSWVYAQGTTSSNVGGNLILGTIKNGKSVKILTGSTGSSSIVATFNGRNTNATTTNSGSLQVVGGVGISQNLYAGTVYSNDGYFRGPAGYGSILLASGGALYADSIVLNGAGTIKGPAGYLNITLNSGWNTAVRFTSTATVGGTAAATSTTTGALIVSGGAGIAKDVYVGGNVNANKFVGDGSSLTNVTITQVGNILGTGTNVSLVAGSYTYTFDNTGTFTMPVNGDIAMPGANAAIQAGGAITAGYNSPGGGTAFIAGNAAVNNIALGYQPTSGAANMAIRDLSTVSTYMYFDAASNTTSTNSQFVFRSSSAYTTWGKIDQYGINLPTRPAFRVYGSGTTSGLTTTQNTNGVLNGNNYAIDIQQGSALSTSTGIFTVPVAGLYSIHLSARVVSNTSPTAQVAVVKNYASSSSILAMWETAANSTVNHFGVSTIVKLAVGDTLVVKVTVGSITFDANDNWAVAYIG